MSSKKLLGITAKNVLAIGDNYNDVEMLAYAGIGVAMGNAPADVRSCADWVAPSISADGVADRDRKVYSQFLSCRY